MRTPLPLRLLARAVRALFRWTIVAVGFIALLVFAAIVVTASWLTKDDDEREGFTL